MPLSSYNSDRLRGFYETCLRKQHEMLGYPVATDYDYENLWPFFQFSINNVGDWAQFSNYPLNTFEFEQEVIEYFCQLFCTSTDQSWGYVTNGGTEGNLYGCYLARECFPDGIVYFSEETHYSLIKIVHLLNMDHYVVDAQENGEIEYFDLEKKIGQHPESPPIIFANIGTTMVGAVDNLDKIKASLNKMGFDRSQYYLHADAAFHGLILPYEENTPPFSFTDGIDSIAVSGHKMMGTPIPCGVVLGLKKHVDRIDRQIEYIASPDKTITGSRNGLTPLFLWHSIYSSTEFEKQQRVRACLELAENIVQDLNQHGIPAWRNAYSPIVVFPKPSERFWRKHHLAVEKDIAHIIITGETLSYSSHLYRVVDELITELMFTKSQVDKG